MNVVNATRRSASDAATLSSRRAKFLQRRRLGELPRSSFGEVGCGAFPEWNQFGIRSIVNTNSVITQQWRNMSVSLE